MSNSEDHDFCGFYEGGGSLARLQLHLARGARRDNRGDLLATDRNCYLRHQAANANRIDSSHELIAAADAAYNLLAFLLGTASSSEQ